MCYAMRVLACFACIAAARGGSPACDTDIQEAAAESALAFANRAIAKTIPIRLVDYGNVVTDARETELKDIVKKTFQAVAPDGSDVTVTWHSENAKADSNNCDASYLYPESVSASYSMAIHAADFNSANCRSKYTFAGVAELGGDQGATIEDPANGMFQHLLIHEIGHMLNANHATLYGEEYGDPTGALGSRRSLRSGASISTLAAGSLAVLEWLTLLDPISNDKVPELGTTNKAIRLAPGLILSYRGTKGHDAALQPSYQRKCYLYTIATDTPQPGDNHHHSLLVAGPFTTPGVTIGHISVSCTPTAEGALFSVRQGAHPVGYIPDAWPSWFATFFWAFLVFLGLCFAYVT